MQDPESPSPGEDRDSPDPSPMEKHVPLIEERVSVGKRRVEAGRVTVRTVLDEKNIGCGSRSRASTSDARWNRSRQYDRRETRGSCCGSPDYPMCLDEGEDRRAAAEAVCNGMAADSR
jgi:hypothetical protein